MGSSAHGRGQCTKWKEEVDAKVWPWHDEVWFQMRIITLFGLRSESGWEALPMGGHGVLDGKRVDAKV